MFTTARAGVGLSVFTRAYLFAFVIFVGLAGGSQAAAALNPHLDLEGPGLSVATGGAGLAGGISATLNVTVNGPVQQAFLYWVGRDRPCPRNAANQCAITGDPYRDQVVVFQGVTLKGSIIGTEQQLTSGTPDINNIAYRADVTSIVQAAGTGDLSFSLTDGDPASNLALMDGAGLLVVYSDPSDAQRYRLLTFDGMDFAWSGAQPAAAQVTTPVSFAYAPEGAARTGELTIFAGDAEDDRLDTILVSDNPNVENQLTGAAGAAFDALTVNVNIPADSGATTVELVSPPPATSDSLLWTLGALRLPVATPRVCTGVIGDFVWHDTNRNGVQDAGEPGLQGVRLRLLDGSGTEIAATVSAANGFYAFEGLCAGDYQVDVDESTLPSGFSPTTPDVGDDTLDSDGPLDGGPVSVSLAGDSDENPTIDFGYVAPCTGAIGDFVWHDLNRDGLQDAGEPGLDGVRVNLLDSTGAPLANVTTAGGGIYVFAGLCAGRYQVDVDDTSLPTGFQPTPTDVGVDDTIDSDGPQGRGAVTVDLPDDNTEDPTIDFGYNSPCTGTIGDFVWHDVNGNGLQDAGEPGIEQVTVRLKDSTGTVIATSITDAGGAYGFSGLCAGAYTVEVDPATVPAGFAPTLSEQGADRTVDSNPTPAAVVLPDDNANDDTIDFGYRSACTGVIGDFVWEDRNVNGVQDAGEPGIADVKLVLKDAMARVIGNATTNADGLYTFSGLCAGDYVVEVDNASVPPGLVPTFSAPGTDPALDSNISPAGVNLPVNNTEDKTIDFGYAACRKCDGKVVDLVLRYRGSAPARIRVEQKKGDVVVFDDVVQPGGTFAFRGQDKKGTLGTEIRIFVDDVLSAKIHTSCSQPIGPGLIRGDFEVVAGTSRNGGPLCPLMQPPPEPPPGGCKPCEGKVTRMSLQYLGSKPATVTVKQKKDGDVVFHGAVAPKGTFEFSGRDKKGTLGTEILIFVNGMLNAKIHTSCSQPVGPGLVRGAFKVIEAHSRIGGEICPISHRPKDDDDDDDDKDDDDKGKKGKKSKDDDDDDDDKDDGHKGKKSKDDDDDDGHKGKKSKDDDDDDGHKGKKSKGKDGGHKGKKSGDDDDDEDKDGGHKGKKSKAGGDGKHKKAYHGYQKDKKHSDDD